jgi:hypothetical protein
LLNTDGYFAARSTERFVAVVLHSADSILYLERRAEAIRLWLMVLPMLRRLIMEAPALLILLVGVAAAAVECKVSI